jgi:choice-of-anchor C domain-containing protein
MRYRATAYLAGLALAALAPRAGAQPNLVTNGGFEDSPFKPCGGFVGPTTTGITGWTVAAGNVDYICTSWQDDEGIRSIDLTGTSPGTLTQTLALDAGSVYELSFALAGNPGGDRFKNLFLTVGSVLSETFVFDNLGTSTGAMGWVTYTRTFTANEANTLLSFRTNNGSNAGAALDDVSVTLIPGTAVPEPATVALLGGGLGLLGFVARRRRRTA